MSAESLLEQAYAAADSPEDRWKYLQYKVLTPDQHAFSIHRECLERIYDKKNGRPSTAAVWYPNDTTTHCEKLMQELSMSSYQELYEYSIRQRDAFWCQAANDCCGIVWETLPTRAFVSPDHPAEYFPNGRLNIVDSCLKDGTGTAIVFQRPLNNNNGAFSSSLETWSTSTLTNVVNRVADAVYKQFGTGARIGVCVPLTPESVAVYLGIIKAGCIVVSIADSFSVPEIAIRCEIANVVAIFTQDVIVRPNKAVPLYTRVVEAVESISGAVQKKDDLNILQGDETTVEDVKETKEDHFDEAELNGTNGDATRPTATIPIVVLPAFITTENPHTPLQVSLSRSCDMSYGEFLQDASDSFDSIIVDSMAPANILFSSGTTGTPKAIVWSHVTPIKSAVDGYFHQNLNDQDVICWPTSLGWMMGSWLIAQRINGTTIALNSGLPHDWPSFAEFLTQAKVTMLGVIPSLVSSWYTKYHDTFRLPNTITRYSSTGEASDPIVYHWLMSRKQGYVPIIEYCGGTEIGGSFLSSVLCLPNIPSHFNTPVLGSELALMDQETQELLLTPDTPLRGELVLVPPTIGYSTVLLNRNHDECYFSGMPKHPTSGVTLRRHGDAFEHYPTTSVYRALGRCDDTMNLGGIKVSSVELERVVKEATQLDCAAIGIGHPSQLILYVVVDPQQYSETTPLLPQLQSIIKKQLNPLFHLRDVVLVDSLPRTASNKVMRRLLRDDYEARRQNK